MEVDSLVHLAEHCVFKGLVLFCRAVILASRYKSPLSLILFVRK